MSNEQPGPNDPTPPLVVLTHEKKRVPVLPKVHLPLKAAINEATPNKVILSSLQEGMAKWFKRKETRIEKVNFELHTNHNKQMIRRRLSSSCLELKPSDLPQIVAPIEPDYDIVCKRCYGFLKIELVPPLPQNWVESPNPTGKTSFINEKTKEKSDLPPLGTTSVSIYVFQRHGTTKFICKCRARPKASSRSPDAKRQQRHLSLEVGAMNDAMHSIRDQIAKK